jgi:hypothetical protein
LGAVFLRDDGEACDPLLENMGNLTEAHMHHTNQTLDDASRTNDAKSL